MDGGDAAAFAADDGVEDGFGVAAAGFAFAAEARAILDAKRPTHCRLALAGDDCLTKDLGASGLAQRPNVEASAIGFNALTARVRAPS